MTEERRPSSHTVEVVPFSMYPHPDANSLSIVDVSGGYKYVARTADWRGVDRAAYIPPDNIVKGLLELADGKSQWSHATNLVIREGCVIKTVPDRYVHDAGRMCLKVVSGHYLEKYR